MSGLGGKVKLEAKQASVYWFDPEPTKGVEICNFRPCVVISAYKMSMHLKTAIIAPLTTTIQPWPFRLTVELLGQKSSIACDQLRPINKTRLRTVISVLKTTDKIIIWPAPDYALVTFQNL